VSRQNRSQIRSGVCRLSGESGSDDECQAQYGHDLLHRQLPTSAASDSLSRRRSVVGRWALHDLCPEFLSGSPDRHGIDHNECPQKHVKQHHGPLNPEPLFVAVRSRLGRGIAVIGRDGFCHFRVIHQTGADDCADEHKLEHDEQSECRKQLHFVVLSAQQNGPLAAINRCSLPGE